MAKEIFIDTHLDLTFSPLAVTSGINVSGAVADIQTFDRSNGQYAPDWTMTYLVLQPWMRVTDPDGIIPDGPVQLANMHWYITEGSVETEILNGPQYQIAADGRLSIRRNIDPGKTILLRFTGEYLDSRTGDLLAVELTHSASCEAESAPVRLILNQPPLTEWDPTTGESPLIVLKATALCGMAEVPAAEREFVWEKKDPSDTDFAPVLPPSDTAYDHMDYDVQISADGTSLTLDRSLMGEYVEIRCRLRHDPYGNPSAVTLTERSPSARAMFTRSIPVPDVRVLTPQRFDPSQKTFTPEAVFFIGRRQITDPSLWWRTRWYISKGVAAGTISRTLVGEGLKPALPTASITQAYGATLQPGIKEISPLYALTDSSGHVLTDSSGRVIVATVAD